MGDSYVGCVPPPQGPAGATFTFATDTIELRFNADTLALKNVTVMQEGVLPPRARQGLLHTDDPWQSSVGLSRHCIVSRMTSSVD